MNAQTLKAIGFRAAGYAFPVITIPVFAKLLPSTEYGKLGVTLTFCSILQALAEGGHTISGARRWAHTNQDVLRRDISIEAYAQRWVWLAAGCFFACSYYALRGMMVSDWLVLAICFFGIVVADAMVPNWVFQGSGTMGNFGQALFYSRAIAFPLALLTVWLLPTAIGGAIATCLPFLLIAVASRQLAARTAPLAVVSLASTFRRPQFTRKQLILLFGSVVATVFPAIVMQVWALLEGQGNLGTVYLSIALWVACRQLAILPTQNTFHRTASAGHGQSGANAQGLLARHIGVLLMALAAMLTAALGPAILEVVLPGKYPGLTTLLAPMLLSGCVFVMAHNRLLLRVAKTGVTQRYTLVYSSATLIFVLVCVAFHELAAPEAIWPLPAAIAVADAALLLGALWQGHQAAAR